jgi:hypothetical protein
LVSILHVQPAPKKKITFRRAEEFVRDHRARAKDTMRMQRVVKKQKALQDVGKPATAPEGKLALVVRVFPTKGACLKTRKILQHFRLWQLYSAVFVRLDEKSLAKLKQVRLVEVKMQEATGLILALRSFPGNNTHSICIFGVCAFHRSTSGWPTQH